MELVLTYSLGRGNPEPWRYFRACVMLNAADIIAGRGSAERPSCPSLWVDSGGYQLLTGGLGVLSVREVVEAQASLRPDYAVMPDDPRSPERCLERYGEYAELASEAGLRAEPVPVVHTTWKWPLVWRLREELDFRILAVGGVARGLGRPFRIRAAAALLAFIWRLRQAMRGVKLHVLGVGGPSLMPALAALNVASVDTASWIHDARYGIVRVGARAYTVKRKDCDKLPRLPRDFECSCPACREDPEALWHTGLEGLRARALHNAYNLLRLSRELACLPRDPWELASRLGEKGLLSVVARALLREVRRLEEGAPPALQ